MPLSIGDSAPDFTLFDDERTPWTLSDHRGHAIVLLFFPGAFTSVCTTEMNAINNDLARYTGGGASIVGLSADAPAVLAEFKKVNDLNFPLLSDHEGEVSEAYRVQLSREEHLLGYSRVAKRAVFVVGADGTITHAEVTKHPGVEPDYDSILEAIDG